MGAHEIQKENGKNIREKIIINQKNQNKTTTTTTTTTETETHHHREVAMSQITAKIKKYLAMYTAKKTTSPQSVNPKGRC